MESVDKRTAVIDNLVAIIDLLLKTIDAFTEGTRRLADNPDDRYLRAVERLCENAHQLADPIKELWRKAS